MIKKELLKKLKGIPKDADICVKGDEIKVMTFKEGKVKQIEVFHKEYTLKGPFSSRFS